MVFFALGLLAACTAVVWWAALPVWQWLFLLLPIIIPGAPRAFVAGLLVGFLSAAWAVHDRVATEPLIATDAPVVVEGEVVGLVERSGTAIRFQFETADPALCAGGRCRLRVSWRAPDLPVRTGDRWRLPLQVHAAAGPPLPGGFDRERWLFRADLDGTAHVLADQTASRTDTVGGGMAGLRGELGAAVEASLGSTPTAALVRGLAVGDRSGFDDAQWAVLNATGTTHLVAISGLHIGLVAGLVFLIGRWLARLVPGPVPATQIAAGLALVAAGAYAALAGFAIPTQRALVMFGVVMLLLLLRRRTGIVEGVALAASAVLLLDPLSVMDAGLFLSFGLVLSLLTVVASGDRPGGMESFLRVQWVAGLAVLPLLMFAFEQGPLASPLANFVAVPVFMFFAVPAALAGTALLSAWPGAGEALLALASLALEVVWPFLELLAVHGPQLPAASVVLPVGLLAMVSALALVLPGPVMARAGLLAAFIPLVAGIEGKQEDRLVHWPLAEGGALVHAVTEHSELIYVQASDRVLRRDVAPWLERRQPARSESAVVVEPTGTRWRQGVNTVAETAGSRRVFATDVRGLENGQARHCRAGAGGADWAFTGPEAGWEDAGGCRLRLDGIGPGELHLQANPLGVRLKGEAGMKGDLLDPAGKVQTWHLEQDAMVEGGTPVQSRHWWYR